MFRRILVNPCSWIIAGAVAVRLVVVLWSGYAAEDAFITFRFARQLAAGNGFVYNPPEHIYGTTTPLQTILLAGWLLIPGQDVLAAARFFSFIAMVATYCLVSQILKQLGYSRVQRLFVLGLLGLSSRFWFYDTSAMETPLVIFFLAASWYAFTTNRFCLCGLLAGLLLWTRIDTFLWPLLLILAELRAGFKNSLRIFLATGISYLPWVCFAWFYFSSPIPFTINAKWVAYGQFDTNPLVNHLITSLKSLSAIEVPVEMSSIVLILSLTTLGFAAWQIIKSPKNRTHLVLPVFVFLEITRLVVTRATFFSRYYAPALWVLIILAGLGLGCYWERIRTPTHYERPVLALIMASGVTVVLSIPLSFLIRSLEFSNDWSWVVLLIWIFILFDFLVIVIFWRRIQNSTGFYQWSFRLFLGTFIILGLTNGVLVTDQARQTQLYRHEMALKAMGQWLNQNTPVGATVQLEPLGYSGYYADRVMLDEVGLVTPRVVELKREGILDSVQYIPILKPDYVVVHCDDALRWKSQTRADPAGFANQYGLTVRFNPLQFNASAPLDRSFETVLARSSCYEIWESLAL